MPTALEKQGHFSASVDKSGKQVFIKDPTLIAQGKTCAKAGDPGCFPNAIIPASRINSDTQKLLAILPTGNATPLGVQGGGNYNYVTQGSVKTPVDQQVLRVDYNLTPKWQPTSATCARRREQNGADVASVTAACSGAIPSSTRRRARTPASISLSFPVRT